MMLAVLTIALDQVPSTFVATSSPCSTTCYLKKKIASRSQYSGSTQWIFDLSVVVQ